MTKCVVIRVDNNQPFIPDATLVTNQDGSVSFQLPDGAGWAGQEPNQYGVRHPNQSVAEAPGAYQRATLNGSAVTFVTRPQDLPFVYLIGVGQAY
jgi:hypothetical protein